MKTLNPSLNLHLSVSVEVVNRDKLIPDDHTSDFKYNFYISHSILAHLSENADTDQPKKGAAKRIRRLFFRITSVFTISKRNLET